MLHLSIAGDFSCKKVKTWTWIFKISLQFSLQAGLHEPQYHGAVNQPLKLAGFHHQPTYVQVFFQACLTKVAISHFFPLPLDHNLRSIIQDCLILSHVHISHRTLKPDLYTQDNKYLWVTYKVVTHSHSSAESKGWISTWKPSVVAIYEGAYNTHYFSWGSQ